MCCLKVQYFAKRYTAPKSRRHVRSEGGLLDVVGTMEWCEMLHYEVMDEELSASAIVLCNVFFFCVLRAKSLCLVRILLVVCVTNVVLVCALIISMYWFVFFCYIVLQM